MVIYLLRYHGDSPVCGRAQKWTLNGGVGRGWLKTTRDSVSGAAVFQHDTLTIKSPLYAEIHSKFYQPYLAMLPDLRSPEEAAPAVSPTPCGSAGKS
jgi:hypothetical protein